MAVNWTVIDTILIRLRRTRTKSAVEAQNVYLKKMYKRKRFLHSAAFIMEEM